jgi:Zn-finger protein
MDNGIACHGFLDNTVANSIAFFPCHLAQESLDHLFCPRYDWHFCQHNEM